jgi:GNAT superfamily N-acetyltransferase
VNDVRYREVGADDRERILALRRAAFPTEDIEKQSPDFWKWEFTSGYAGAARIFIAEAGKEAVAHLAFVPQRYAIETREVKGAIAVDAMTDPRYRGRGIFRQLSRFAVESVKPDFDLAIAFQIREAVLPGMLAAGWRVHSRIPILLRPISLRKIAAQTLTSRAASLECEVGRRLSRADALALPAAQTSAFHQPRSDDFVRWRYTTNDSWPYRYSEVRNTDGIRAWVIHRDVRLRRYDSVAVADLGCATGAEDDLAELLRQLLRAPSHRPRAFAAAFVPSSDPLQSVLRRAGFRSGPHHFRLLLNIFDPALEPLASRPWRLNWGDTDHL